ncbi:hypothetical protein EKO04_007651 [Ascochyta lentis]|uniref:Uncharacterized protein n=1 Tax=Ascochyta lentis TaxID=205686 RepID=A0A8H7IXV9_9PLEO|nr:hypothetical protein EKO04_007651 [Ascochyta lentis]
MAGQQTLPRKKLSPKSPSRVLKKRKTFVAYNRRDCELTAHQQSWARSLAVSLSGWRKRQAFLQAQLEAHLKNEAEREAQEAVRKAALQAEEGERRAQTAKLQAEAAEKFARDAAAYQKRASEIHQANMEDGIEEETVDEDMHAYTKKRSDVESPNLASPADIHPTPVVQPAVKVDWRIKAQMGIEKKKLTVDKGWSALTWNQKSNVHERLLLLESGGYDITELQDRKASSEEITAIILELAAAQQKSDSTSNEPIQKSEEVKMLPDERSSSPVIPHSSVDEPTSSPAKSPDPSSAKNSQPAIEDSPISSPQKALESIIQSDIPPIIEEDTQPFCFDEPYHPRASPPLKRKRDYHSDAQDLEDTAAIGSYPARKKRNMVFCTEDTLRLQALQEIKRKVFRRVFRPTRSICQKPSPFSKVVFPADASRDNRQAMQNAISILDYLYTKQPVTPSPDEPLSIPLTGYHKLMAELRFLTSTNSAAETNMTIIDPDFDDEEPDKIDTSQSEAGAKDLEAEDFYREKSRIIIFKDEQGCQVFQGDTLTLAKLFQVLQQQELFHHVVWEWDGLRLSPSSNLRWSLGPETQNTLLRIVHHLRQYAETGGAEIWVHKVDNGRAGHL